VRSVLNESTLCKNSIQRFVNVTEDSYSRFTFQLTMDLKHSGEAILVGHVPQTRRVLWQDAGKIRPESMTWGAAAKFSADFSFFRHEVITFDNITLIC
jgi:hypothetical protein